MAKISIKEETDQKVWDTFVQKFSPNNFLASWQWCEFNDLMGDRSLRLAVYENNKLIGLCGAFVTVSKKGNFLLSPAGPLFLNNDKDYWFQLTNYLTDFAKSHSLKFIRIRPLIEDSEKNTSLIKSLGFVSSPVKISAEQTLILEINKSEDELLGNMRKTTRYLIRKAQKDGVQVETSDKVADLEKYHSLEVNTVAKHKFTPFSKDYVKTQFEVFQKTNDALIFFARYEGRIISSAIITFFGDSAFYNHGASVDTKIPASYILQWNAVLEAKRRGKRFYNFWGGITTDPKDPWYGITLFKAGFGGKVLKTIHAHDLPLSKLYKPMAIFENLRYKLRGHSL